MLTQQGVTPRLPGVPAPPQKPQRAGQRGPISQVASDGRISAKQQERGLRPTLGAEALKPNITQYLCIMFTC
jgi:hypothetical protein